MYPINHAMQLWVTTIFQQPRIINSDNVYLHVGVTRFCLLSGARSTVAEAVSCDDWWARMTRYSTPQTRTPRAPTVQTIHRTTVRVACFRFFEVISTASSAWLSYSFSPGASGQTTAARSSAGTPRCPTVYSAIDCWTTSSPTTPPGIWKREKNTER